MIENQKIEKELGQILIEANLITAMQLKSALKKHEENGQCLAKNLADLGYLNALDMAKCIAMEYKIPETSLNNYDLKEGLVNVVPENISNAYGAIPLDVIGNILIIGMIDTPQKKIVELLEMFTGFKIQAMLVTTHDFYKYMQRLIEADNANIDKELENHTFGAYVKTKLHNGVEKRKFPRFQKKLKTKYYFYDRHFTGSSVDISRGGALVVSSLPLPLNSNIKLQVELPTFHNRITILSKVVRVTKVEKENLYRIGFNFTSMNNENYDRLVKFIKSLRFMESVK